jgi:hypothetical protein
MAGARPDVILLDLSCHIDGWCQQHVRASELAHSKIIAVSAAVFLGCRDARAADAIVHSEAVSSQTLVARSSGCSNRP